MEFHGGLEWLEGNPIRHALYADTNKSAKRLITDVLDNYLQTRVGPWYEHVKGLPDGGITLRGGTGAGNPIH